MGVFEEGHYQTVGPPALNQLEVSKPSTFSNKHQSGLQSSPKTNRNIPVCWYLLGLMSESGVKERSHQNVQVRGSAGHRLEKQCSCFSECTHWVMVERWSTYLCRAQWASGSAGSP